MTLIETYSGYVLLYLLAGLACQLIFYVSHIARDLGGTLATPHTDRSFFGAAFVFLMGPVIFSFWLGRGLALIVWDALKAYRGLFRLSSGTEELIFALFWVYIAGRLAWEAESASLYWLVAICAVTALFLMQSARAMQKLKRITAEAVGESPPPEVMNKFRATVDELRRYNIDERARDRERLHAQHLHEIRQAGERGIARVNAHADAGGSLDRHRERLAVSYKYNPYFPKYRYPEE